MSTSVMSLKLPAEVEFNDVYLGKLLKSTQEQQLFFTPEIADWLQDLRNKAATAVVELRMPSTKDEEWRFTDLSELLQVNFQPATVKLTSDVTRFALPEATQSRLVFVNGVYCADLSDVSAVPEGVYVGNLGNLPQENRGKITQYFSENNLEVFTALNTASISDLAVIWANPNVVEENPIQLINISVGGEGPSFSQPRTLIVAETGSCLQLVEYFVSEECGESKANFYFTNAVTEIWLAANAQVIHNRIQQESKNTFHLGKSAIAQGRDSRYTCNEISLGGKLYRHNLVVRQTGEQTETILNGLTIIKGEQLADTHSTVSLTQPHGNVNQLHKCIVDEKARAVFNGKIFVPQAAQMTNATQINRNLLLSPKARVNTKPELQITADNVKCSHGATVSQLEADEVFYLRSRGLSEDNARHLLIDAFAADIIERIPVESLRQRLTQCFSCLVP
ncbi:MAG: Fe-S cluster assembly protein SufD [Gomphosphaeria aponina SAG 52.96 = DSM 107014]|uniref:Fe-S cluster assembly protein SufD n=1 Tax=Gomphosphaeria aponina SAG 52.96 = DSM 107014 TaxID=1521640 RepID=A0A941GRX3_9CHRO|nr:Fe-S cluster assembly protein SufD [Gomphosphaeria aponina SAG 52.96 = DSM 107014]